VNFLLIFTGSGRSERCSSKSSSNVISLPLSHHSWIFLPQKFPCCEFLTTQRVTLIVLIVLHEGHSCINSHHRASNYGSNSHSASSGCTPRSSHAAISTTGSRAWSVRLRPVESTLVQQWRCQGQGGSSPPRSRKEEEYATDFSQALDDTNLEDNLAKIINPLIYSRQLF